MSSVANLLNGVSGVVIGAYLIAVLYQSSGASSDQGAKGAGIAAQGSNFSNLLADLEADYGYLEFIAAAGALALLADVPALRPFVGALTGVAIFAVLVQGAGAGGPVLSYLEKFGKGQIGLFGEPLGKGPASPAYPNAGKSVITPPAGALGLPALPSVSQV